MLHAIDLSTLGEAEIVAAARAGDGRAFSLLMQRHNQRLFRVARAILAQDDEAEDALQEAYVRAFTHIADFRGDSEVGTWLTRIVINEARGRLRRRRTIVEVSEIERAQGRPGGDVIDFPGRSGGNPEADAARHQMRDLLEHALDALPPLFRIVFILREVEGLSGEETATQLGLRPATVRTRLHRARAMLRAALESQVHDALAGTYPFLGKRCEAMTEVVLERLRAGNALSPANAPRSPPASAL